MAQPNAAPVAAGALATILESLALDAPAEIRYHDMFSNDLAEVRLADGRSLVVKRGRHDWARARFAASREASRSIRARTGLLVPEPLPLPATIEAPHEVYWRIDQPTLDELWPRLDEVAKAGALRNLGRLAAELHSVSTTGFGRLTPAGGSAPSLEAFLREDLEDRLIPAILAEWPAAAAPARGLAERIDEAVARASRRARPSRLLHGDLHMANVLCRRDGKGAPHCVGLLDLETAQAGPREADLAVLEIHHGRLFDHPVQGDWMVLVREGYGHAVDDWLIGFYRAYHLLNMGFYSALIGHRWHARRVARAVATEVAGLTRAS